MKSIKIIIALVAIGTIGISCKKDYRYADNVSDQAANANGLSGTEWMADVQSITTLVNDVVVEQKATTYTDQSGFVLLFTNDLAYSLTSTGDTAGVFTYNLEGGSVFLLQQQIDPSKIDSSLISNGPIAVQVGGSLSTSVSFKMDTPQVDTAAFNLNRRQVRKVAYQRMR